MQDQASLKDAGHSKGSATELASSYVVSLTHPDWENRIKKFDTQFQSDYLTLTKAFKQNLDDLVSKKQISVNAPIFRVLKDRTEFLEQVLAD